MDIDALFASPWGALVIFGLRIIDVSLDTMRVIFAIRGKRGVAAMLGFVQALVWIFAVASAVKHLDSVLHVLGYAGGYATGTFVGVSLENAIAYGVATVRIVTKAAGSEIAKALRCSIPRGESTYGTPASSAAAAAYACGRFQTPCMCTTS